MRAKKRLGQHFLIKSDIAQRTASALVPLPDNTAVLEVGPGKGMLTQFLDKLPAELYLVEIDHDMIPILRERFPHLRDRILRANFLQIDPAVLLPPSFSLIGNFPYNISSQILIKMLDHRWQIPQMVGMFQLEVAQRIVSDHGSKSYGILSVLCQAFYRAELCFTIDPSAFVPPPKVNSAVIHLLRRDDPPIADEQEKPFRQVVKAAFGQRRKMLRNSLKSLWPEIADFGDYATKRPEQLTVANFVDLTVKLISSRQSK